MHNMWGKGHERTQQDGVSLQARKRALTRNIPCWHPDLRIPASKICEKINVHCVNPPDYGILSWQSALTKAEGTHIINDNTRQKESQEEGCGNREDGKLKPD